mgnify:CR=1 FL=1
MKQFEIGFDDQGDRNIKHPRPTPIKALDHADAKFRYMRLIVDSAIRSREIPLEAALDVQNNPQSVAAAYDALITSRIDRGQSIPLFLSDRIITVIVG